MNAFSNPSNDKVYVSGEYLHNATITLFDLHGRCVATQKSEGRTSFILNVENLEPEVYILRVEGSNYRHTSKLIVSHK